jgi:hypothetical protein
MKSVKFGGFGIYEPETSFIVQEDFFPPLSGVVGRGGGFEIGQVRIFQFYISKFWVESICGHIEFWDMEI